MGPAHVAEAGECGHGDGPGPIHGVVDIEFKVHGVRGLRVADASVVPAIPSSPTQALCMVLGEACGELLLKG